MNILIVTQSVLGAGVHSTLARVPSWSIRSVSPLEVQNVVSFATDYRPDVTIFDTLSGSVLDLLEQVGQQQVIHNLLFGRFLVVTSTPNEHTLFGLVKWGASAYVHAWHEKEELIDIVKRVSLSECQLSYECLQYPVPLYTLVPPEPVPATVEVDEVACHFQPKQNSACPLTKREQDVLYEIALGLTNRTIARDLKIASGTIRTHITSIFGKFGVNDRTAAVIYALARGWIPMPPEISPFVASVA